MKKEIRSKGISKHFYINCDCIACSNNWPTITEMYEMPKVRFSKFIKISMNFRIIVHFLLNLS